MKDSNNKYRLNSFLIYSSVIHEPKACYNMVCYNYITMLSAKLEQYHTHVCMPKISPIESMLFTRKYQNFTVALNVKILGALYEEKNLSLSVNVLLRSKSE